MAIEKREYFIVECDSCNELLDIHRENEYTAFETKEEAEKYMGYNDWRIIDDKLFCLECQEVKD